MKATTHSVEKTEFQSTRFEKRIPETLSCPPFIPACRRSRFYIGVPMPAKGPGRASGPVPASRRRTSGSPLRSAQNASTHELPTRPSQTCARLHPKPRLKR